MKIRPPRVTALPSKDAKLSPVDSTRALPLSVLVRPALCERKMRMGVARVAAYNHF